MGEGARERQAPRPALLWRTTTLRPRTEAIAPCPADAHVVRWGLRAGNLYSHSEYMAPLKRVVSRTLDVVGGACDSASPAVTPGAGGALPGATGANPSSCSGAISCAGRGVGGWVGHKRTLVRQVE